MRTGDMYLSLESARQAGVPDEHIVEVESEIVVVTSGPFRGRRYQRTTSGLIRLPDVSKTEN